MMRSRPPAKPAASEYQRRLPHVQHPGQTMFVTFATWQRWVLPESVRGHILEHCLHDHGVKLTMHAAVVMPDHVHLLFSPMRDADGNTYGLAELMSSIKGASSHTVNKMLVRSGRVWGPESFDHALRLAEGIRQKAEYICQNPVRAGLVSSEDEYPWLWRELVEGAG